MDDPEHASYDQDDMIRESINCPKGALPRFLYIKCPVGVTVYDDEDYPLAHEGGEEEENNLLGPGSMGIQSIEEETPNDIVSWMTEENGKAFFIPHYSDAEYIEIVTHRVIENGATMFVGATALVGSSEEPYDDATFDGVQLEPYKTFRVYLNDESGRIDDFEKLKLLIWENGDAIGEVDENGVEFMYTPCDCTNCACYDCRNCVCEDCDCVNCCKFPCVCSNCNCLNCRFCVCSDCDCPNCCKFPCDCTNCSCPDRRFCECEDCDGTNCGCVPPVRYRERESALVPHALSRMASRF